MSNEKIDKKKVKELIEDYEYYNSGISHHNGAYAKAVNVKINNKDKKVTADVLLVKQMERTTERYNDCEYTFDSLGLKMEDR